MNGDYVQTIHDTSTLADASYYPWGRFPSNTLTAGEGRYGRIFGFPTESVSWRTPINFPALSLERNFEYLTRKWKKETVNLSSIQEIVMNQAYQRIIGMGPGVIPLILQELERCPAFWFWALRCLTGANPVTQDIRGDIAVMTEAWLNWGREHGYL